MAQANPQVSLQQPIPYPWCTLPATPRVYPSKIAQKHPKQPRIGGLYPPPLILVGIRWSLVSSVGLKFAERLDYKYIFPMPTNIKLHRNINGISLSSHRTPPGI